ncbi:hypothetical protein B0H14DRAFT_3135821 [Mycena olivaceomarginata]|nr:hypothetical protein B0H14DRAFT_3135821 [Mycena olivaceomarginata]
MSDPQVQAYVGNLSWNTNDDQLREAFCKYGNVVDCIAMKDRETGRARGFGFVTFSTEKRPRMRLVTCTTASSMGALFALTPRRRAQKRWRRRRWRRVRGGGAGYGGGGYGGGGGGGGAVGSSKQQYNRRCSPSVSSS